MGRRAATLASGRRVAELGECAITGDTAGGSAGSCLRPRPPTAAVLGMLAPWSPLLRRAKTSERFSAVVRSFAPSPWGERAAHSRTAARNMSTNALIKDWAKGGKEKMCVPACPPPDAQAPSPSPCKVHVLH